MLGNRYFSGRYFGRFFHAGGGEVDPPLVDGGHGYFGRRYFPARFFAPRYFGAPLGGIPPTLPIGYIDGVIGIYSRYTADIQTMSEHNTILVMIAHLEADIETISGEPS